MAQAKNPRHSPSAGMFPRPVMSRFMHEDWLDDSTHGCFGSTRDIRQRLKYFQMVSCEISRKDDRLAASCGYSLEAGGMKVQLCLILERRTPSSWCHLQTISKPFQPGNGEHSLVIPLENPPHGEYRAVSLAFAYNSDGRLVEGVQVITAETVHL